MPYFIDQEQCARCGVCEGTCNAGAIVQDGDKFVIQEDKCTDCAACVDACPVGCIKNKEK